MGKNQKNYVFIIAISISAIVFIGCYLAYKLYAPKNSPITVSQTPVSNNQVPNDSPSNWKNYRNDQLGFELKYPADSKIDVVASKISGDLRTVDTTPGALSNSVAIYFGSYQLNVLPTRFKDVNEWYSGEYQRFIETEKNVNADEQTQMEAKDITIGGLPGKKITLELKANQSLLYEQDVVIKNNEIYTFYLPKGPSADTNENFSITSKELSLVIRTFGFINTDIR
jgi:hypothetical protein